MQNTHCKAQIMTAGLIITHACNLNCVYCYERNKSSRFMSFDRARSLIEPLLLETGEPLMVMLMGGEPLLAFPLIQSLIEYTEENRALWKRDCFFFASTNGTLLDDAKKTWFHEHRSRVTLALSFDGVPSSQNENRCLSADRVDLDYFIQNWPQQRIQMTINANTVNRMAEGVLYLTERGAQVNASVAYEADEWSDEAIAIYLDQLLQLMDYYLDHPDRPLIYQFLHPLEEYVRSIEEEVTQGQQCGAGCGFVMFDDDGSSYPCHMLSSLVLPEKALDMASSLDISALSFQDPRCAGCPFAVACPTCMGSNLIYRGDAALRDETHCKLQQLEVRVCLRYMASLLGKDPSIGTREQVHAIRKLYDYLEQRAD